MVFHETGIAGVVLIEPEPKQDERGAFARTFCAREFVARGLRDRFVQSGSSWNPRRLTLRGLHYQRPPSEEAKLVRCPAGAIFDAVVDLREGSRTFKAHCTHVLSARNRRLLYIPEGCAHGFLTLEDDTEVSYQMSAFYRPDEACVRWNDPAFGIAWPESPLLISTRDAECPDFEA